MVSARKFGVLMLCVMAVVFIVSVIPAHAIWHVFLDEHFNKDQQNPNLRWPWFTDLRNGIRWHWNPWPPYFRFEPNRTDYCWGLVDNIFNSHVTPRDAIQQSLWCAYTNRGEVDNSRWPDPDDFMPMQNAWVWWGPVSLEEAVSANVSFWLYLSLANYARDSLSVAVINDPDLLTLNDDRRTQNVNEFRRYIPVGRTYSHRINNDWVWQSFYLDSLYLNGREDTLYSMLGEPEVYIAFVWQSDEYAVARGDKGAFIDDVIFAWDDGLFDIVPTTSYFGYFVNEDSTDWRTISPRILEDVRFRCDYRVIGVDTTGNFEIRLMHNDTLWYSTIVNRQGSEDTTYTVFADTLWECTFGTHEFVWEFDPDVREGGVIREGNENNNTARDEFTISYNPAPDFDLLPSEEGDTVFVDGEIPITVEWTLNDTLSDNYFNVYLYWTEDTTGLAGNLEIVSDYGYVGRALRESRGEGGFDWSGELYTDELRPNHFIKIVALATDNYPGNYVWQVSPSWYCWYQASAGKPELTLPAEFGLDQVYPNPFNGTLSIGYGLPLSGNVELGVYDMSGRLIQRLANEFQSAGQYLVEWQPADIPAGLYVVRMQSGANVATRKVVYMP